MGCTLTLSQAEINCFEQGVDGQWDAEDPRCIRLSLTGRMEGVKDTQEKVFAEQSLVSRHPNMKEWLELGDFHVVKLNIQSIWLIDMLGGTSMIDVQDYFNSGMGSKSFLGRSVV